MQVVMKDKATLLFLFTGDLRRGGHIRKLSTA